MTLAVLPVVPHHHDADLGVSEWLWWLFGLIILVLLLIALVSLLREPLVLPERN